MNTLRRVGLPLALAASAAGGAVLSRIIDPRHASNPVVRAEVVCPANTKLVITETHKLLSEAAVEATCEDTSDHLAAPLAVGSPGIRNPAPGDVRTAPPSVLYIAYKPGDGGEAPEINNWVGDGPHDILQLVGARAIVDVSFKEP